MHKDLRNPHYVAWRKFLGECEDWDREKIEAYQLGEVRSILNHAYLKTPGYRELLDIAGVSGGEVESLDDLSRIPFTSKDVFQDRLDEFSADVPGREYVTTGGSTGIPMGLYRDQASFARELASKAHQYNRIGWKEGDRQIVFRGLPVDSPDGMEFVEELQELRCSTYEFVPDVMEGYRRRAVEYQPEWMRCYPSAGYMFATFLEENCGEFPKLKGILCASEMLFEWQKEKLETVFGCRVFSHYGHYEMAALAGFCEYNDLYHVLPQYGFVELIDDRGHRINTPGEKGEIVATSFIMRATPFIRYQTGDEAIYYGEGCPDCGRPYQLWERIEGRRQEMIVGRDGRMVSMTMLNMHDDIYDGLRQYQFHQSERGVVTLRYVPRGGVGGPELERVRAGLIRKLGDNFVLEFEEVERIEPTKRGKHRSLVQELEVGVR
jgi:phenylacetate-CoA ligase